MDFGGNVKNPFLFDDPAPAADGGDIAVNPFLNGGGFDFDPAAAYTGINPFSDQIDESTPEAMGIFGDATAYPVDMNPFGEAVPVSIDPYQQPAVDNTQMITNIFSADPPTETPQVPNDLFGAPAAAPPPARPPRPVSRPASPVADFMGDSQMDPNVPGRPPPPRPPPPSKETKDLLSSVIGAMEATTDDIQGKLNTTRTPCPSPGSAIINSRSPTPDIQVTAPDKSPDAFSAIFGQTIDEDYEDAAGQASVSGNEPQTQEEFDLFGSEAAKPKTTQDILSLFNKPASAQAVDLLSDDLLSGDIPPLSDSDDKKQESVPTTEDALSTESNETPVKSNEKENVSQPEIIEPPSTEGTGESRTLDGTGSPEQVSDKTDSELTVIEAPEKQNADEANEGLSTETNITQDQNSVGDEKTETLEAFDSPEPGQTITQDQVPAEETEKICDNEDKQASSRRESSAMSEKGEIGAETAHETEIIVKEVSEVHATDDKQDASVNKVPDELASNSGDAAGSPAMSDDVFGVSTLNKENEQTSPPQDEIEKVPSDIFGVPVSESQQGTETPFDNTNQTETVDPSNIFGSPNDAFGEQPVPSVESTAAALFGDMGPAPTGENFTAGGLFGDIPNTTQAPAAGLFGDVPEQSSGKGSTGFDIFGAEEAPEPAPSGADSTGAALFGTAAPAPNVGMSLFGGGNEPTLDIFAESDSTTLVNPFAPSSPAPTSLPSIATPKAAAAKVTTDEEFDAFSARFESVAADGDGAFDPFGGSSAGGAGGGAKGKLHY